MEDHTFVLFPSLYEPDRHVEAYAAISEYFEQNAQHTTTTAMQKQKPSATSATASLDFSLDTLEIGGAKRKNKDGQYEEYDFDPRSLEKIQRIQETVSARNSVNAEVLFAKELRSLELYWYSCARCGALYREIDNFQWRCVYHPGVQYVPQRKQQQLLHQRTNEPGPRWSCCHRLVSEEEERAGGATLCGCKLCDHRTTVKHYDIQDNQRIPKKLLESGRIRVHPSSIVNEFYNQIDPALSYFEVKRFQS